VKVLVAGDFRFRMYEEELCWGLRQAGADVIELPVSQLFGPGSLLRRAQTKYVVGPGVALANAALVADCGRHAPDAVLAYRAPWLHPLAMEAARGAGARVLALYNNDDPFGPDRELPIWRSFRRAIPAADLCLTPREVNEAEYRAAGARDVHRLRFWYSPRLHRPMALTEEERARYGSDVTFIGHAEADGRADLLEALLASGLRVKLFGAGWEALARGRPLERLLPAPEVHGDDYAKALCAAKAALVFLSARNRDRHTYRCFEIPACGVPMLLPRNPELTSLFREGDEALFYEGRDELLSAARRLCGDDPLRARLGAAARDRVQREGHGVADRARELLGLFDRALAGARQPRAR
jgi:hypothetical protein